MTSGFKSTPADSSIGTACLLTIVIPTTCSIARGPCLLRAIDSVKRATDLPVRVLVIANGPAVSTVVLEKVRERPEVVVLRQDEGSYPKAVALGRMNVYTKFFGVLDDDDEFMPGALGRRIDVLLKDLDADVAVSNGMREIAGVLSPMHPGLSGIEENPLRALLHANFLASCAAVFRSGSVGPEFFQQPQGYAEWTWLGFKLCIAGRKFRPIDAYDYIVHDTPASLSKSAAYHRSYVSLYDRMLSNSLPTWARRRIHAKRCAAYHELSVRALDRGEISESLSMHWRSLRPPHGLRYFLYGRHIAKRALPFRKRVTR